MTHQDAVVHHAADHGPSGSTLIPVVGSSLLALLWGAYTIMVFYEIVVVWAG